MASYEDQGTKENSCGRNCTCLGAEISKEKKKKERGGGSDRMRIKSSEDGEQDLLNLRNYLLLIEET